MKFSTLSLFIGLLLVALAWRGDALAQGKPVSQRDVAKHVKEYVEARKDKDRESIAAKLAEAQPSFVAKEIKKYLANEKHRPVALYLAIALRTAGLCSEAIKFIDTEDEDRVVELLFLTQDGDVTTTLAQRWHAKDIGSAAFECANRGFLEYCVDVAPLDIFAATLKDKTVPEDRRARAAAILQFQMGLGEQDPAQIDANWKRLRAEHVQNTKSFLLAGEDLGARQGWSAQNGRRVGRNWLLSKGGTLTLENLPKAMSGVNFTLRFRLLPISGKGHTGYLSYGGDFGYAPTFDGANWTLEMAGGNLAQVAGKKNDWNEIDIHVGQVLNDPAKRGARIVTIKIGGVELLTNGLTGDGKNVKNLLLEKVLFQSKDGCCAIGGIEIIPDRAAK